MSMTGRGALAQFATADREIVMSRVINAPPEVVFEAFSQVRHLYRWWGPDGFTTTTRAFEFRVGGLWDFVMHGPDGTATRSGSRGRKSPRRSGSHCCTANSAATRTRFASVLTFEPEGAATRIEMRTVCPEWERGRPRQRFRAVWRHPPSAQHCRHHAISMYVYGADLPRVGYSTVRH